jgi:hypothetical protein
MNPASSLAITIVFPRRSPSSRTRPIVASLVVSAGVTSINLITGGGLKKCMPMTLSGRSVTEAKVAIGIDEVLVARTTSWDTTPSSDRKIASFCSRSSVAASITRSTSARSSTRVVPRTRDNCDARASASSLPRSTARPVDVSSRSRPRARSSSVGSRTVTSMPARDSTSTIPEPMSPKPTTPT